MLKTVPIMEFVSIISLSILGIFFFFLWMRYYFFWFFFVQSYVEPYTILLVYSQTQTFSLALSINAFALNSVNARGLYFFGEFRHSIPSLHCIKCCTGDIGRWNLLNIDDFSIRSTKLKILFWNSILYDNISFWE